MKIHFDLNLKSSETPSIEFVEILKKHALRIVLTAILGAVFFVLLSLSHLAYAQSGAIVWEDPINLSRSGITKNPKIITNSEKVLLVFWDEDTRLASQSRTGFSIFTDDGWTSPTWNTLPFTSLPVRAIATDQEEIRTFWIGDDGRLRFQNVRVKDFGFQAIWNSAESLGTSVAAYDVKSDSRGVMHLVFLTTDATGLGPAGIYYSRTFASTLQWTIPINLYSSEYYQRIEADSGTELEGAGESGDPLPNVNVETVMEGDEVIVFLSWSNEFIKRIFSIQSVNGGISWGEVEEVDGPSERYPYRTPTNLITHAGAGALVRLWYRQQSGGSCTITYQISADHGESWGGQEVLFDELTMCPERLESFNYSEKIDLLLFTLGDKIYFTAWDGVYWSKPRLESSLGYFKDPDTFDFVQLGCHDMSLVGDELVIVGCDKEGGGDIWFLRGRIDEIKAWFEPILGWSKKAVLEIESSEILSVSSAFDSNGMLHTLWAQQDTDLEHEILSTLFYSGWDGERAVGPFVIMDDVPGLITNLSLTTTPDNQLVAVWNSGVKGEIFSTWTSSEEASSASGWNDPKRIDPSGVTASHSGIQLDSAGSACLLYAIPANRSRGLYVYCTEDSERTFSLVTELPIPSEVDCPLILDPELVITSNDSIHVTWQCVTFPGGIGGIGLHHMYSGNDGKDWIGGERIVDKPVLWSRLVDDGHGHIHLVWVEQLVNRTQTVHRMFGASGESWSDPTIIISDSDGSNLTDIDVDSQGRLHLVQVKKENPDELRLLYRQWYNSIWSSDEDLIINLDDGVTAMAAAVGLKGNLTVIYFGATEAYPELQVEHRAIYAQYINALVVQPQLDNHIHMEPSEEAMEKNLLEDGTQGPQVTIQEPEMIDAPETGMAAPQNNHSGLVIGGVASFVFVLYFLIRKLRPSD